MISISRSRKLIILSSKAKIRKTRPNTSPPLLLIRFDLMCVYIPKYMKLYHEMTFGLFFPVALLTAIYIYIYVYYITRAHSLWTTTAAAAVQDGRGFPNTREGGGDGGAAGAVGREDLGVLQGSAGWHGCGGASVGGRPSPAR